MKNIILLPVILLFVLQFESNSQSNWILQNAVSSSELRSIFFINESTGWLAGFYKTLCKTTNGGINWTSQNAGDVDGLVTIYFVNNQTGWIGGGHQGLSADIIKTTNGGINWFQVYHPGSGMVYNLYFLNSATGWATCDQGKILKTTNGGINWSSQNLGVNRNITNCFFVNSTTAWVNGDYGTIMKTTNGGVNWVQQTSGTIENLEDSYFFNSNTGVITGYNGKILKTTDGGLNWLSKSSGSTYWLNSIHFVNSTTGWIMGGVYGDTISQILRTCDAGENWSIISSPAKGWLSCVQFINLNTGWAVGSNGMIIKTTNGGSYIAQPPPLISPPNNSIVNTLTPALVWNLPLCANSYKVQVSNSTNFNTIIDSGSTAINQFTVQPGKLQNNIKYYWRVNSINTYGVSAWSSVWNFIPQPIGIETISSEVPESFSLSQNYPNPFNPKTSIKFDVPEVGWIKLTIYNILGDEISVPVNKKLNPGTYKAEWDASSLASGVYFYKLTAGDFGAVRKMVLIK